MLIGGVYGGLDHSEGVTHKGGNDGSGDGLGLVLQIFRVRIIRLTASTSRNSPSMSLALLAVGNGDVEEGHKGDFLARRLHQRSLPLLVEEKGNPERQFNPLNCAPNQRARVATAYAALTTPYLPPTSQSHHTTVLDMISGGKHHNCEPSVKL